MDKRHRLNSTQQLVKTCSARGVCCHRLSPRPAWGINITRNKGLTAHRTSRNNERREAPNRCQEQNVRTSFETTERDISDCEMLQAGISIWHGFRSEYGESFSAIKQNGGFLGTS